MIPSAAQPRAARNHTAERDTEAAFGRGGGTPASTGPPRSLRRHLLRLTERTLAFLGAAFLFYHLTLELTVMTSDSMTPALQGTSYENGDRILLEKVTGAIRAPQRWEIFFYYDEEGTPVAKRVVGMPGERISISNRLVHINGVPLERPKEIGPARYYAYGRLAGGREVACDDGYFMLGDSSIDSLDSRYTGVVTRDRFRGRAWLIVAPPARRGWVR